MAESLHILLGTSACLQWLCHSGERTVALLLFLWRDKNLGIIGRLYSLICGFLGIFETIFSIVQ